MNPEPVAIAEAFVRAINRQNAGEIAALMTDDHVFIDSDGAEYRGKERMRTGWEQYFRMFPDYRITIHETYSRGEVVVFLGIAEGTYAVDGELRAENRWSVPAAWRAVVRDDGLAEWRLYVNVEPIVKILAKHQK